MSDFTPITTQEDFDKAIQKRIAQAEKATAERFEGFSSPDDIAAMKAEYEKKLSDAAEELKKATEKIAGHDQIVSDLTTRATKAETSLLKNKVAHANGVPLELADRLAGDDEEALTKDAQTFASFMKPKSAPPSVSTEYGQPDAEQKGLLETLRQMNMQMQ